MDNIPLEQKNEIALAVGHALHAWSGVEEALSYLFTFTSGIGDGDKSRAIFNTIVSFETRLDVCNTCMIHSGETKDVLAIWAKLYNRLSKFYKKRHQLAHFALVGNIEIVQGKAKSHKVQLAPFWPAQGASNLSAADIRLRHAKFVELKKALNWFWSRASCRARGVEYREPEPDLVQRLRSLVAQTPEGRKSPPRSSPA